ncbi:substrate-binding periplasmic protein [Cellulosilyticum sp. I15G10I2]|uniref:substrate-binding periplasmic protein n=1 Tax=Cellulosilyticum sp. I15G10I2 TaxID=1892843 RepID=UPI00085BFF2C|nr:transporter substrate-binding domain-containing protein [Cellulosilyticum sp. I15G10I2]
MSKKEINKCLFVAFLIIVTLLLLTGCSTSKEYFDIEGALPPETTNSLGAQNQKILIVTGEYLPYVTQTQDNNGFFAELIKEVLDHSDIEYEIKFYPWARCAEMVQSGEAWASFPYGRSESNRLTYLFSDPIYTTKHKFYYLVNNEKLTDKFKSYSKISDFSNYIFGGTNSYWYGNKNDITALGIKSEWASDTDALLKMLHSGRIDFFIEDELVCSEAIKRLFVSHEKDFAALPRVAKIHDYFLIASKKYPNSQELLNTFNHSLQTLKEDGRLEQILKDNSIAIK